MFRTSIASAVALFVFVSAGSAAEVTGRLVKVDAEKNTITLSVGRRGEAMEKTYNIAKDAKFVTTKRPATPDAKPTEETIKDGIKADTFAKPGTGRMATRVTLTVDGEGDKAVVTKVAVSTGGRRPPRPPQQ